MNNAAASHAIIASLFASALFAAPEENRRVSPADEPFAAAVSQAIHVARPVAGTPGHWWVRNPRNGLNARFTPEGLSLMVNAGGFDGGQERRCLFTRWSTTAIGYGDCLVSTAEGRVTVGESSNRVEINRSGLIEWFVNREEGLEHGYTLPSPPADNRQGSPLRIEMALEGDLAPEVAADGRYVILRDANGTEVLRYEKLKVWDAEGRELAARMAGGGRRLSVEVNDMQAVYPLTIDPIFTQQAYLKASNTGAGDVFGDSIAISGDTVVVGARLEDSNAVGVNGNGNNNTAQNAGAAYVFVRNGTTWVQQAYLKASNPGASDVFGWSVAIDGDTIVVGAIGEASNAVGVNGNGSDNSAATAGAAYVFTRSGTTWTQQAYLKASNTGSDDWFGDKVAIDGDTIVVGAWNEDGAAAGVNGDDGDNSTENSGAAYVFARSGTTWTQQAYLKASNTDAGDGFGSDVGIDGDTVVVGAHKEDSHATGTNGTQASNSATDSGAAYVYVRAGSVWTQQAYLKASNTGSADSFGTRVSIDSETIVVGASGEDSSSIGVDGNQSSNGTSGSGAAYVFVRNGTTWTQQAYLKASNTGASDSFGQDVAVHGNTAVIGAPWEDSGAIGIDGDGTDNNASSAGAAYVYTRNGESWTHQAYLKPSNTDADDNFGMHVDVDGYTIVAGSRQEDSGTTGVNGDETNNAANAAGAAFVFHFEPVLSLSVLGNGVPIPNGAGSPSLTDHTDFGAAATSGGTVSRTFTLSNEGDDPIVLADPLEAVGIAGSSAFSVVQQPASPILPGNSTSFTITFEPSTPGAHAATISFANNVPGNETFTFAIGGMATQPLLSMQVGAKPLLSGIGSVTFKPVSVRKRGKPVTFTLLSNGTAPLTGLSVSSTGRHRRDFLASAPLRRSLAPGETTIFKSTFRPSSRGTRTATLEVRSNAANGNVFRITTKGRGK